jgi:hypothetical protein
MTDLLIEPRHRPRPLRLLCLFSGLHLERLRGRFRFCAAINGVVPLATAATNSVPPSPALGPIGGGGHPTSHRGERAPRARPVGGPWGATGSLRVHERLLRVNEPRRPTTTVGDITPGIPKYPCL